MSLDFTKTGQEILLAQINADNPEAGLTTDNVVFSYPIPNPTAAQDGFDTAIRITPVPGAGFWDEFVYRYNRVDLATVFSATNSSFDIGTATKLSGLVDAINAAAGIALVAPVEINPDSPKFAPGDFLDIDLPIPPSPQQPLKFILSASPYSFIYKDSAILTLTTTSVKLASVITTPSSGLVFAPAAS